MKNQSLTEILSDFNPNETSVEGDVKSGRTLTIWISAKDKARYDRIQEMSGRRLSKKIREVVLAALDLAEKKVS